MVRRVAGIVLIGLGVFALVLAVLFPSYVVPKSKKTPLDLNITQRSSGAAKLFDAATGKTRDVTLRATRVVKTDSVASDAKNTTVFETLCIVIVEGKTPDCVQSSDPRLLSITTDRVTADRKSGESVDVPKYKANVNGDANIKHVGLSYKFPLDTAKKTYQFFQPDLGKAFPAVYKGTAKVAGLTTYKFVSATGDQKYKIQGTFPGKYNDTRTVFVEPKTGAIINGTEHQVQTLDNGTVALDTTLSFDKSAVTFQANFAKSKIDQLDQARVKAPLGAGLLGVIALIGGILLLRGRRSSGPAADDGGRDDLDGGPTGPTGEPGYAGSTQR